MESETAYSLLHVPRTASSAEILFAYRKESLKYHPRRFDPGERFIEIHFKKLADAYETLSDAQKRVEYDSKLDRLQRAKNPNCFDPRQPDPRQRRHSLAPAGTYDRAHHHRPAAAGPDQDPPRPRRPVDSAERQTTRARRSSVGGLAPIPKLIPIPLPAQKAGPSSSPPAARAGSCAPTIQTSTAHGYPKNPRPRPPIITQPRHSSSASHHPPGFCSSSSSTPPHIHTHHHHHQHKLPPLHTLPTLSAPPFGSNNFPTFNPPSRSTPRNSSFEYQSLPPIHLEYKPLLPSPPSALKRPPHPRLSSASFTAGPNLTALSPRPADHPRPHTYVSSNHSAGHHFPHTGYHPHRHPS